jgi:nicotinate-nucleotide adenylyltransferase
MSKRIVIFGGTFDPVHHGHLIVARDIAEARRIDRITLVPTGRPPHKEESGTAGVHRLAMCELVARHDPLFDVSDVEVGREGPSYTIETVETFRRQGKDVTLIIGTDMLEDLPRWHRAQELAGQVDFLVAARPPLDEKTRKILESLESSFGPEVARRLGESIVETSRIEISSTQIRRRLETNRPVSYLTPGYVIDYIRDNRLYGVA